MFGEPGMVYFVLMGAEIMRNDTKIFAIPNQILAQSWYFHN